MKKLLQREHKKQKSIGTPSTGLSTRSISTKDWNAAHALDPMDFEVDRQTNVQRPQTISFFGTYNEDFEKQTHSFVFTKVLLENQTNLVEISQQLDRYRQGLESMCSHPIISFLLF